MSGAGEFRTTQGKRMVKSRDRLPEGSPRGLCHPPMDLRLRSRLLPDQEHGDDDG
jgi:hypothetical protein